MFHFLWDTRGYFFWLLLVSAFVLILERLRPWRSEQRLWRRQFGQDLVWLFFNGHLAGILVARAGALVFASASPAIDRLKQLQVLGGEPVAVQFAAFFILKDLMEWGIHNLLHRVSWLWEFHKVHHSIEELDWIGNFRFHWMEIVVYRGLTYLPLTVLGVEGRIILGIAIVTTLVGHLNHSNLDITWGPLRYVLNSPRMHVWHHDRNWPAEHPRGVNFGISLSIWDWIARTAWWPAPAESPTQQPRQLGFDGMERLPRGFFGRFIYPLQLRRRPGRPAPG